MNLTQDFEEYDEVDTSDDDCGGQLDRILVPKLPVAQFDDYDPNRPPVTGAEYLRRVQLEAQKCPEVVVADMDLSRFKSNQTLVYEDTNGFIRLKPELIPPVDWQREQVSEFSHVRTRLAKEREHRLSTGSVVTQSVPHNRPMNWWREFCIGKTSDNNSSDDSSDESICDDKSDVSTTTDGTPNSSSQLKRTKRQKPEPNVPLLSTLCGLTQDEVVRVLSYHIQWIRQFKFTQHMGLWIYSLLVCLDKPLPADVYSTLRDLSRVCSECRQRCRSTSDDCTEWWALNLIICLIGGYFDQTDMCDQ
ncbi:gem-associated protein 2-like [Oppia nitens]|uniref:gem-associated protein 2-like n=1 Tax=Oppia nitens TaxID=1686743 RepID=UPI0023DC7865|nr:gem-associated protein 2-like [Oppia nitens]